MINTLDISTRLPDVSDFKSVGDYDSYGRVAWLRGGYYWFGGLHSSHPTTTEWGMYWAIKGNILFLSPRGARFGWENGINQNLLSFLQKNIGTRFSIGRVIR